MAYPGTAKQGNGALKFFIKEYLDKTPLDHYDDIEHGMFLVRLQ